MHALLIQKSHNSRIVAQYVWCITCTDTGPYGGQFEDSAPRLQSEECVQTQCHQSSTSGQHPQDRHSPHGPDPGCQSNQKQDVRKKERLYNNKSNLYLKCM